MKQDSYLTKIAARLYERIDEAEIPKWADASIGEWTPKENQCHENVSTICEHTQNHTPVRGWLYFDLEGARPYVWFNAHSLVRDETGIIYDITPSKASQQYPFIVAEENEQEYGKIIERYGVTRLTHYK